MPAVARHMVLATLLQLTIVLLWLPLAALGGGSDDKGPVIDISFPLPNSNLAGVAEFITVRDRGPAVEGTVVNQIIRRNPTFAKNGKQPPPWLSDTVIGPYALVGPDRAVTPV